MAGFGAPRRGPRLPPSVLLVLLAVLGLLAFNYWSVSGRQAELTTELGAMQAQAERTEVARLRLERRNTELLLLIDEHRAEARREREQRGGLEQRLWGSQGRQIGMQENMSRLMADIAHLKEKLTDLNQAFLQREDQLHELHTNNTYLLNRLEQESLRCGEQIKELKVQHEARVIKLPEAAVPDQTAKPVGLIESSKERKLDFDETAKNNAMKDTVENFSMMVEDASKVPIKNVEEAVNPEESDAGMPELEENGAANLEDHPAALKKPLPLAPEVILNLQSKQPKDSKLVTGSLMTLELKPDVGNPPDPLQIQPLEMHSKQNTENSRKELFPKKRNTSFLNLKQNDEERDAQEDPADYRKDSINDAL